MPKKLRGAIQRIEFYPIPAIIALAAGGYVGFVVSDFFGPIFWVFTPLWAFVVYAFWVIYSEKRFVKKIDAPTADELEDSVR